LALEIAEQSQPPTAVPPDADRAVEEMLRWLGGVDVGKGRFDRSLAAEKHRVRLERALRSLRRGKTSA
jgi:hypothetical protein